MAIENKKVVYQVFTRLFGNKVTINKPWGTIEENGVGKFNDFTDIALQEIKNLGVTHIWYTGVIHHALIGDYTEFGISNDNPEIVKGRAGSPYAIKDYYNVNPDLAVDVSKRMEEFEALIERTHNNGLKVIIDIVPNHVARKYEGKNNPLGVYDFGVNDNKSVEYDRNNDFYYIVNQHFESPSSPNYKPLNGEYSPVFDTKFEEFPAKWTGNGSRNTKPDINDWYETIKLNYGIRPDGSKDFDELPTEYYQKNYTKHFHFWNEKNVPPTWKKLIDIALFWTEKGVDGFRYDMAEMAPMEFWSYMNSSIKMKNPDSFLMAEVYNPNEYRNYIYYGKMDYLYDKVETYDHLKAVIQGKTVPDGLSHIRYKNNDIEKHLLTFLDNHDEQRLANEAFAGTAERGKPLMVVSATINSAPTMIYFGQEVGESANFDSGFGKSTRTSIFDYCGVPNHQRWMNNGKFDGGQLLESEKQLRDFYKKLLNFVGQSEALTGAFDEIQTINRNEAEGYDSEIYSFVRYTENEKLIVVSNFSWVKSNHFTLKIPQYIIEKWNIVDGKYSVTNQLYGETFSLTIENNIGFISLNIKPSESFILKIEI